MGCLIQTSWVVSHIRFFFTFRNSVFLWCYYSRNLIGCWAESLSFHFVCFGTTSNKICSCRISLNSNYFSLFYWLRITECIFRGIKLLNYIMILFEIFTTVLSILFYFAAKLSNFIIIECARYSDNSIENLTATLSLQH